MKCGNKFSETEYCELNEDQQRLWLHGVIRVTEPQRKLTGSIRRKFSHKCLLTASDNKVSEVYQLIFRATLEYANDGFIKSLIKAWRDNRDGSALQTPAIDMLGRHKSHRKADSIQKHILTFNPPKSHYCRTHVPNK